ncbi:MAG TPA: heavy metal-responsive transcriptional regulator [Candidatus Limnocylindrales bacterium]
MDRPDRGLAGVTDGLRIGEVARSAGVNIQTLRYYERRGLVVPPFRRHSGQREYDEEDIRRVRIIKAAQRLGFTLAEIQEMFDLSGHRRATGELHDRATAKVAEIDERIARLQAMRADLSAVIAAECDSLTDCSCGLGCPLPFVELSDGPD